MISWHAATSSPDSMVINMSINIKCLYLPLDEAIASRAVFVIVSGSDGRTETLFGAS